MFQHPDHEQGTDGSDGQFVPYGLRVKPPERINVKRWRQTAKLLSPLIGLAVMAAAVWVLIRILRKVELNDVYAGLSAMSIGSVLGSLALVALSYICLIGYDFMSLEHLGKRVSLAAVTVGGFVSFALANTLGFVLITAGGVRYRVYGTSGVTAPDVAVITIMSGLTFALSAALIMGVSLLLAPNFASLVDGLPVWINFTFGLIIIGALGAYLGWVSSGRKAVSWSGYELSLPGPLSTVALLASGVGDMLCASAAVRGRYHARPAELDSRRHRRVRDHHVAGGAQHPDGEDAGQPAGVPRALLPDPDDCRDRSLWLV
jgi:glycosyltransferase 2 family protein